ncbi:MAG: hypothetical protein WAU07_03470 [Microgenomates group bacterium]
MSRQIDVWRCREEVSSSVRQAVGLTVAKMLLQDLEYGRQLPNSRPVEVFSSREHQDPFSGSPAVASVIAQNL